MIAMALSGQPNLLIADEPTTALDVTTQAQILELMAELQEELGMAMMLITHNLGVVAQMAEQIIVMYLGKIVERTDVKTLFNTPKHPYTEELLKSIPRLRRSRQNERLTTITGTVPPPYIRPTGCPFHPRCPKAIQGLCDVVEPKEIEIKSGHSVSCLLYSEQTASSVAHQVQNG
jgi:peptide/nickel transport system ATP-binding protein